MPKLCLYATSAWNATAPDEVSSSNRGHLLFTRMLAQDRPDSFERFMRDDHVFRMGLAHHVA